MTLKQLSAFAVIEYNLKYEHLNQQCIDEIELVETVCGLVDNETPSYSSLIANAIYHINYDIGFGYTVLTPESADKLARVLTNFYVINKDTDHVLLLFACKHDLKHMIQFILNSGQYKIFISRDFETMYNSDLSKMDTCLKSIRNCEVHARMGNKTELLNIFTPIIQLDTQTVKTLIKELSVDNDEMYCLPTIVDMQEVPESYDEFILQHAITTNNIKLYDYLVSYTVNRGMLREIYIPDEATTQICECINLGHFEMAKHLYYMYNHSYRMDPRDLLNNLIDDVPKESQKLIRFIISIL